MIPLYHDPHFTFRFADNRIIPCFHLEGVEVGRRVSVFKIDPGTGERLGLLATATVGEDGWVSCSSPSERGCLPTEKPSRQPQVKTGIRRIAAEQQSL